MSHGLFFFWRAFVFFGGMSEGHLFLGGFGFWLDEKRPFVLWGFGFWLDEERPICFGGGIWFLVG
jgi:hypothetical protein